MRQAIATRPRARRGPENATLRVLKLENRETPAAFGFSGVGAAFGADPVATVLRPDGSVLARVGAYDPAFRGGVNVAVNEIDGNLSTIELVTGAGTGGGPHVKVFAVNTATGAASLLTEFMAYEISFRGGVNVAAGDLNGNSTRAAVVTAPGFGGGPVVKTYAVAGGVANLVRVQVAFDPAFRGGANIAAGNFDGNGINGDELAVGAGPGGGPHVRVFASGVFEIAGFMAFDPAFRGGAFFRPASAISNQLVVTAGPNGPAATSFSIGPNGSVFATILVPFG